MMALENASGKDDDFDDEGLPLLPRHTKVGVPTRCDTPLKKKRTKKSRFVVQPACSFYCSTSPAMRLVARGASMHACTLWFRKQRVATTRVAG